MRSFQVARSIHTVAYGPDSTTLWIGDGNARVHRWDLTTDQGEVAFRVPPGFHTSAVYNLAVSADGRTVAASSYSRVALADVSGSAPLVQSDSFPAALRTTLSRDGSMLALAGPSGEAYLWDLVQSSGHLFGDDRGFATNAAFSTDGTRLAISFMTVPGLVIFDTETLDEVASLESQGIETLLFSPDDSRLVVASENDIVLWDTSTWQPVTRFRAGQAFVRRMAIHPDGELIATAADVKMVCLWDLNGKSRGKFDFEVGKAQAVAFAPDGMTAAVGGSAGKVAVWDLEEA